MIVLRVSGTLRVELDHVHAPRRHAKRLPRGAESDTGDGVCARVSLDLVDLLHGDRIHRRSLLPNRIIGMRTPRRLVETRPTAGEGRPLTRASGEGRARGLVSSRASGRRVEARRYAAPEGLCEVVDAFWTGSWDLRGQAPHVTELLSDP